MKKLLVLAAMMGLSATSAYAAGGTYIGAQLGYGDTGYEQHHAFIPMDVLGTPTTDISGVPSNSVNPHGVAGRAFAGYQFNPNLAVEAGYSLFSKTDSNAGSFKADISTQAVDACAKLLYPINNAFSVYGKGGAAWVHADQDVTGLTIAGNTRISETTDPIRPLFGAGAGYNFTHNLALDASWTRIEGNNNIQNIDFYGAGLTYYFG